VRTSLAVAFDFVVENVDEEETRMGGGGKSEGELVALGGSQHNKSSECDEGEVSAAALAKWEFRKLKNYENCFMKI
jgi:hypothetical protein